MPPIVDEAPFGQSCYEELLHTIDEVPFDSCLIAASFPVVNLAKFDENLATFFRKLATSSKNLAN